MHHVKPFRKRDQSAIDCLVQMRRTNSFYQKKKLFCSQRLQNKMVQEFNPLNQIVQVTIYVRLEHTTLALGGPRATIAPADLADFDER